MATQKFPQAETPFAFDGLPPPPEENPGLLGGFQEFIDELLFGPPKAPGGVNFPSPAAIKNFIFQVLDSNLTQGAKNSLIFDIQNSPSQLKDLEGRLNTEIDAQDTENRLAAADARLKEEIRAGGLRLDEFEDRNTPLFESAITRFTGGELGGQLDPNFVQNDAEFGEILSQGQASINSGINRARNNAALSNVNAGVANSGKNIDQTSKAESKAVGLQSDLRQRLNLEGSQQLSGAKKGLTDFERGILDSRGRLGERNLAGFNTNFDLFRAQPLDFTGGRDSEIEAILADLGIKLQGDALGVQAALGFGDIANNTLSTVTSAFTP